MMVKNKRGISIIIGYVLLITIAIVISSIVYQWVKTYIPTDPIECPDGVSVFVKESIYSCQNKELNLTIKNNGRFNIGGYLIHATISPDQELASEDLSPYTPFGVGKGAVLLFTLDNSLKQNDELKNIFDLTNTSFGRIYSIEIIPVRFQGKSRVNCANARIIESISCFGGIPSVAEFFGSPTSGNDPLNVTFTDLSTNSPTIWSWNFGDSGTSTLQNPIHIYNGAGTYTVSLTATNSSGSDTETKTNYITVSSVPLPPVANFSGSPTSGDEPLIVTFTDLSTNSPTNWSWNFGDNGTSTLQNPVHTYDNGGDYTVALTATNAQGFDIDTEVDYITVSVPLPPVAAFSGTPTSGDEPLTVTFTDLSTNSPTSWSWNFGDSGTSTLQNPIYSYSSAGTYTVTLTATNAQGSDIDTKVDYITVVVPPIVAEFSGSPTSGDKPLTVTFTDLSTNSPTSWSWNFGDSGTSTLQNPTHIYNNFGTYTVALTATNAESSDTETKTNYITAAFTIGMLGVGGNCDSETGIWVTWLEGQGFIVNCINPTSPGDLSTLDVLACADENECMDFSDGTCPECLTAVESNNLPFISIGQTDCNAEWKAGQFSDDGSSYTGETFEVVDSLHPIMANNGFTGTVTFANTGFGIGGDTEACDEDERINPDFATIAYYDSSSHLGIFVRESVGGAGTWVSLNIIDGFDIVDLNNNGEALTISSICYAIDGTTNCL